MAQKANLTPEPDRREAERLDLEKQRDWKQVDRSGERRSTAEHQRREGLSFWQAIKTVFK
jgi:hypothetical protein